MTREKRHDVPPKTLDILNRIITRAGLASHSEVARVLHQSRATLYEQLGAGRAMSPTAAVRAAQLLGEPPLAFIAATQYQQARRAIDRDLWLQIWRSTQHPA